MTEEPVVTVEDVARWMADKLAVDGILYQRDAAEHIATAFGDQFLYENANGNLAIKRNVLDAFGVLTPDAGFHQSYKAWEPRKPGDAPGRRQY